MSATHSSIGIAATASKQGNSVSGLRTLPQDTWTLYIRQLKKLSRKDGQIPIKLIYRQTGFTTFDLIKDYKSGWKAFWSNNTAKIFDLDLKAKYAPMAVHEDYWIETILYRAFQSGRLVKQDAVYKVDYDEMSEFWIQKIAAAKPKESK